MSKTYQVFMHGCHDVKAAIVTVCQEEDCGLRECVRSKKSQFFETTETVYPLDTHQITSLNTAVIHVLTTNTDGVTSEEASLLSPVYNPDNDTVTETIPVLAFIAENGRSAFVPSVYDLDWL